MTHDDELRELRERAYGPHPDRSLTLADRERLEALERQSPVASTQDYAVPRPLPQSSKEQPTETALASGSDPTRDNGRNRQALRLLWAGTIVATCAIATAAVILTPRLQAAPLTPTARQVARLSIDPDGSAPGFFASFSVSPADATVFDGYSGLTVIVTHPSGSDPSQSCVYVYDGGAVDSTTSGLRSGQVFTGCSAGAFPATVEFVVDENQSAAVRSTVAIGAALQFVYDEPDDQVVVFLSN